MTIQNSKFFVKFLKYPVIIFLAIILGGSFHIFTASVLGWTNPSGIPSNDNTAKPINVGSASQTKTGNLTMNSASYLAIGSGYRLRASGNYIDFGETGQTIRDPGDYYIAFGPSGTDMFNFFTTGGTYDGRLGIGTASPSANLHVSGTAAVTGNATVSGYFWTDGPANFCTKESPCSGSACASCSLANYYVVTIGGCLCSDSSSYNCLCNPSSPPASGGYRICCKNSD